MPATITVTPDFPIWMRDGALFAELIDGTAVWSDNNTFTVTIGGGVYTFTGIGLGQRDAQGYPHSAGTITSISYTSPLGSMSITGIHTYASALFGSLGDPVWIQNTLMTGITELRGGNAGDWLEGTWTNDTFYGGGGDDHLNGGDGSNHLFGEAGDDVLIGGGPNPNVAGYEGDDYLDGGTGADQMFGGLGDDTYLVDDVRDRVFDWAGEGVDTVISTVDYVLGANIENLSLSGGLRATGNTLNNTITGNAADNVIDGGKGADILRGGGGSDTYYVDNIGDQVFEGFERGAGLADRVISSVSFNASVAASAGVENIALSGSRAINATGNTLNNLIVGNNAANVLDGGSGADTLTGGLGDDTYYVDTAGDRVIEIRGQGNDTVISSVSFSLLGQHVENLTLTGTAAMNGTGNSLANALIGNGGANVLDGGTGKDTMKGGLGDDTYYVDNAGDRVFEIKGQGIDTVITTVSFDMQGQHVDNLTLTGAAALNGVGNSLNNIIKGNAAANTITGLGGQDTLTGGRGADAFVFNGLSDSTLTRSDRITDLTSKDVIDLRQIDGDTAKAGVQGFEIVDTFSKHAGELVLSWNAATDLTSVNLDVNGDGKSDMQILLNGDHRDFDHFVFGG